MPSWIDCTLYVQGPTERVNAFLEFAKSDELILDFRRILPYCDDHGKNWDVSFVGGNDNKADYKNKNNCTEPPYKWCERYWGTCRNANDPILEELEGDNSEIRGVWIKFSSAWSPPLPVITHAAEVFPELHFDIGFVEECYQFCGSASWDEGKRTD